MLGVSILEPRFDDSKSLATLDAAIRVGKETWSADGHTCRIVFWPRTKLPYVLLTNLSSEQPAQFGTIRLLDGPPQLPPASAEQPAPSHRLALAHIDQAEFYSTFSANLRLDEPSGRYLMDWETFRTSGQRLTEYLRHTGFGGALLNCYSQGGALVSIPRLNANPRFDSGVYFADGRDVQGKDILEMLLRMFDREGLRLVVGLRFSTPLPELENQLAEGETSLGIDLLDIAGRPYRMGVPLRQGEGCYYNPLDRRVQSAISNVVRDIVDRYGRHEAFAGISVDLHPDSFSQLPGFEWGYDRRTLSEFESERRDEILKRGIDHVSIAELTTGALKPIWTEWRQNRISELYVRLVSEMRSQRPDAQLMLTTARLVDTRTMRSACRPALPRPVSVAQAAEQMGIDATRLSGTEGLVFFQPTRDQAFGSLIEEGPLLEYSSDPTWQELLSSSLSPGGMVFQTPIKVAATGIDHSPLFGSEPTKTTLKLQGIHDADNLQSILNGLLVDQDCHVIAMGGPRMPLTSSQTMLDWLSVYQQLPAKRFQAFDSQEGHPVRMQTLRHAGRLYFYVVNDSPWHVRFTSDFHATGDCNFARIGRERTEPEWQPISEGWSWSQNLAPYEMAAGILTDPAATVISTSAELPTDVLPALHARFADIAGRLTSLKAAEPFVGLDNPDFAANPTPGEIAGWEWSQEPGTDVRIDEQFKQVGGGSLRISSQQPLIWVRSEPIPTPKTGRLSVQVMLRQEPDKSPPPFRIALEGIYLGQPYYRYAQVTTQSPLNALPDPQAETGDWAPFILHVDDLPDSGLEQLRVRFDLMAAGTVWVDDVKLYDLGLTADEQTQLSKIIASADYQLREGRPGDCLRTLNQFWPRYLLEFVPPPQPRVARNPPPPTTPPPQSPRSQSPRSQSPRSQSPPSGFFERMRRLLPKLR